MSARKPEKLELLCKEINELDRSKCTLNNLYYTCGATEVAIEHLLRPYNPLGLDLRSLDNQLQNLKGVLDGQMNMVKELSGLAQDGANALKKFEDVEDPEIVDEVDSLCDTLLEDIENLRPMILQVARSCRGFFMACKLVLDFLVDRYSEII